MNRTVSRHVTRSAADGRMQREIEKLKLGKSSGWQRRKFMVRRTNGRFFRYKVVEI